MSYPTETVHPIPPPFDDRALDDLALRLVRAASPSGAESEAARVAAEAMRELGFTVEVDRYGNLDGVLDLGPGPTVLLDAHLDTVGVSDADAWTHDPAGEIADGRLWGRGAMDMKGQLAAAIHGAAALAHRPASGRIVLSASVAEELAEGPMLVPALERHRPDVVIICEATDLRLSTAQRGRAEVLVEIEGRPSHSARPDLGINAVEAMSDVIRRLREIEMPVHDRLGSGILVLTDITSRPYPGLSVVPDYCAVTYDRRTLPGETERDVLDPIRAVVDEVAAAYGTAGRVSIAVDRYRTYTGAEVETPNFAPAWETADDDPVVVAAVAALRDAGLGAELGFWSFCTNGSASAGRLGITTIGYGPGDEALAHRTDEHIALDDLRTGARGYAALIEGLLRRGAEGS